jgi:valyl-tRNA synthetase
MAKDGRSSCAAAPEAPDPSDPATSGPKPELGSGCVKITPAPRPQRLRRVDSATKTRSIASTSCRPTARSTRRRARATRTRSLRGAQEGRAPTSRRSVCSPLVEDRDVEIDHSDRSKTPSSPTCRSSGSSRWATSKAASVMGRGTPKEFRSPGLVQAAIDATSGEWQSPTTLGADSWPRALHQDLPRVARREARLADQRQLWWGHRIPVWSVNSRVMTARVLGELRRSFPRSAGSTSAAWVVLEER